MINLFDDLPHEAVEELFTELLCRKGVRTERIVSTGQSTPLDKPYNQEYDEWVLLFRSFMISRIGSASGFFRRRIAQMIR